MKINTIYENKIMEVMPLSSFNKIYISGLYIFL